MTTRIRASLLALPLLLPSFQAIAALPGMNLGQTSFLDGKALPGTLFQQFVNIYEADDFMDANGHRRPLDNRLRTLLATSHFAHISQHQLFGAYYGAEILVPVLLADPDFEPHAGSANGLGNLIVSPFILQWPQTELFGRPYWQRLNLAFQLPTGRYDRHRAINPGSNHWSFNPHYALTWEFAEGWEASARLQYLLPGKNRDPAPPLADDYLQPGQAFHANYSVSLALDAHWRLGLSGYSLRQITDERVDGHDRPDSRERVDAIGPALMFGWGKSRLFLNAYHEYGARNRSEGSRLILRYSQVSERRLPGRSASAQGAEHRAAPPAQVRRFRRPGRNGDAPGRAMRIAIRAGPGTRPGSSGPWANATCCLAFARCNCRRSGRRTSPGRGSPRGSSARPSLQAESAGRRSPPPPGCNARRRAPRRRSAAVPPPRSPPTPGTAAAGRAGRDG